MANLPEHFKIDIKKGIANPKCTFKGKKYRITVLSDVLIRFEYNENGIFNDYPTLFALNRVFPEMNLEVKEDDKFLFISNNYFTVEYTKEKPYQASKLIPDSNLRVTLTDTEKIWYFSHFEVRNFFGSGYSLDDYQGGKILLSKGLYSPEGFASINDSKTPIFGEKGTIHKNPNEEVDVYLFIYKKDFGLALKSYFELTGYPPLISRYALGIWWSKNEEYNEKNIDNLMYDFKNNEIPLSVLLLDKKWHIQNDKSESGFTFNPNFFPDPKAFADKLQKDNIYLGLNINTKDGISPQENIYSKFTAIEKDSNKSIPINVYNSSVIEEYTTNILNELDKIGVDLFWIDENIKDDLTRLFLLNHYTFTNFAKDYVKRGITLSRNPGIASHRYSVLYSGNTMVGWKTLRYLPFYNSTSSNLGISWWSHDIGGFKGGIEDEELYTRYVQLGVYSPIFRFASERGRFYKREPWKWDYKTLKIVKDYTRIRHRLIPYLYTEAYKYSKIGIPLIQPLYYKYPETYDEPLYKNEYFFGTELFVSPITEPKDLVMNRVVHRIFLPSGEWYDFKTGKKFPGGKRYVTFFKDEDYPVFAKGGSIIPMSIIDDSDLNSSKPPKSMEIQIFPGRNNQYNLYEDDGVSSSYKKGFFITTSITYDYKINNYRITIKPVDGKAGIIPDNRNYKIKFRNSRYPDTITVKINNIDFPYKAHVKNNDLVIEINEVPTAGEILINCAGEKLETGTLRAINEDLDSIISDLKIETVLKERLAEIIFSEMDIKKKRIEIKKLKRYGLKPIFIKMFMKLLEYIAEI